jgi:transposase
MGQNQIQENEHIWQWFGLDVSKKSFTASFYHGIPSEAKPEVLTFESDKKGVKRFLSWQKKQIKRDFPFGIVMESTGYFSRNLADLLLEIDSSLHVSVCNARSVAYYIRSHVQHKTDKTDAIYIARYGYDAQPPKMREKTQDEKMLKEFVSERMKLVNMKTMLSNKNNSLVFQETVKINKSVLKELQKQIDVLDKKIEEVSKRSPEMNAEIELMDSVPGVGRLSASVIYAELGSLKQYNCQELSALSGLYPRIMQSGSSLKKSKLAKTGSSYLRQILYMDATQAMSKIPKLKALRKRLLARDNTCKKTARCAVMRQHLLLIKGVVDSGVPYDPNYKQKKQEKSLITA